MTIKDIAEKAGVSVATVSFVLNDKCVEKKISKATQEKVWETVRELGYQPNVLARTLRSDLEESNKYYITIFWTTDKRDRIMIRFLRGLQEEILRKKLNCEITIKPYENNHLQEAMTDRTLKMCHGIILCNASEKDIFLPLIFQYSIHSNYAGNWAKCKKVKSAKQKIYTGGRISISC